MFTMFKLVHLPSIMQIKSTCEYFVLNSQSPCVLSTLLWSSSSSTGTDSWRWLPTSRRAAERAFSAAISACSFFVIASSINNLT